jgi:hypothetical protein
MRDMKSSERLKDLSELLNNVVEEYQEMAFSTQEEAIIHTCNILQVLLNDLHYDVQDRPLAKQMLEIEY